MPSKVVMSALMTSAFFAWVIAASPALACKGANSLLRDDFTDEDPAWGLDDPLIKIGGGAMTMKSDPGKINFLLYQGQNFPAADACVDMISPVSKNADVLGGLFFATADGKYNIAWVSVAGGTAGVTGLSSSGWTNPVPGRKFDGIKTAPNAVNTIRLTWKGPPPPNSQTAPDPTVTMYVNDKQFIKFKAPPNADRLIGLYAQSEGGTFQFKNLSVTNF
jgi:hypothetical protein